MKNETITILPDIQLSGTIKEEEATVEIETNALTVEIETNGLNVENETHFLTVDIETALSNISEVSSEIASTEQPELTSSIASYVNSTIFETNADSQTRVSDSTLIEEKMSENQNYKLVETTPSLAQVEKPKEVTENIVNQVFEEENKQDICEPSILSEEKPNYESVCQLYNMDLKAEETSDKAPLKEESMINECCLSVLSEQDLPVDPVGVEKAKPVEPIVAAVEESETNLPDKVEKEKSTNEESDVTSSPVEQSQVEMESVTNEMGEQFEPENSLPSETLVEMKETTNVTCEQFVSELYHSEDQSAMKESQSESSITNEQIEAVGDKDVSSETVEHIEQIDDDVSIEAPEQAISVSAVVDTVGQSEDESYTETPLEVKDFTSITCEQSGTEIIFQAEPTVAYAENQKEIQGIQSTSVVVEETCLTCDQLDEACDQPEPEISLSTESAFAHAEDQRAMKESQSESSMTNEQIEIVGDKDVSSETVEQIGDDVAIEAPEQAISVLDLGAQGELLESSQDDVINVEDFDHDKTPVNEEVPEGADSTDQIIFVNTFVGDGELESSKVTELTEEESLNQHFDTFPAQQKQEELEKLEETQIEGVCQESVKNSCMSVEEFETHDANANSLESSNSAVDNSVQAETETSFVTNEAMVADVNMTETANDFEKESSSESKVEAATPAVPKIDASDSSPHSERESFCETENVTSEVNTVETCDQGNDKESPQQPPCVIPPPPPPPPPGYFTSQLVGDKKVEKKEVKRRSAAEQVPIQLILHDL